MPLQLAFKCETGIVAEYLLFEELSYQLGSSPESDIIINHSQISGHHATLSAELPDHKWKLADFSRTKRITHGINFQQHECSLSSVLHFGSVMCRANYLSLDDVARYDSQYFWRKQQLRYCEKSLHDSHENAETFKVACNYMKNVMDCERAAILLLDDCGQIERTIGFNSWMADEDFTQCFSLIRRCIDTKKPQAIGDVNLDLYLSGKPGMLTEKVRAAVGVPIIIENEVVGAVYGDNSNGRQYFTHSEIKLTQSLSDILSLRMLFNSVSENTTFLLKM